MTTCRVRVINTASEMAGISHFWGFFLFVDTSMIPVYVVPEIFWNTAKGIRGISIFL